MNQYQDKTKLESFVVFPRQILSDFRNGKINRSEFNILCYLRLGCDPYGITNTSLENINSDIFQNKVDKSYVNKLMLSLKNKRFLYYHERKGRRGSFEVHFGDIPLPNKAIRTIDKFFSQKFVADETISPSEKETEVIPEPTPEIFDKSQKYKEIRDNLSFLSKKMSTDSVRGNNNNNDNKNNKNTKYKDDESLLI